MITTYTAFTEEIDDIDVAIEDIQSQIDSSKLKANSLGILTCHADFIETGVARALAEAFDFDIIGSVSTLQSSKSQASMFGLSLMVLTSDDTYFETGLSESLLTDPNEVVHNLYTEVSSRRDSKPALILTYAGFLVQNSGDEYIRVLSEDSGNTPIFGTLSVDESLDFSKSFVLYNGQEYRDKMAIALIYGDINPKFYVASVSDDKIVGEPVTITKSQGHILMEVNDEPILDYFKRLGLGEATGTQYAMTGLPFLLDYGDGSPKVSKVFIALDPDNNAICAGIMPEGAKLYMGVFDPDDVIKTTSEALDTAKDDSNSSAILAYACISRSMTLGATPTKEMEFFYTTNEANGNIPYLMASSGGEIGPTVIAGDKAINRFHNNAFVMCKF
ncbi:MAG: FIST C-terminal domain-containing protein [Clostridiales Family XIII bacterium]|jgi:hypothetical protein|nr:FIST C-terminal domain-containing protein [Clostridiales Family XIII bacterium]